MADLQCVICDYTVPHQDDNDEVLVLLGAASVGAGEALIAHMQGHTLSDWVKAFKMADAYIAQLEAEVESLKAAPAFSPARIQAVPPFQQPNGYQPDLTPAEQQRLSRQDQIRRVVETHDHNETLIPRIPDAVRPEGVVGVKY